MSKNGDDNAISHDIELVWHLPDAIIEINMPIIDFCDLGIESSSSMGKAPRSISHPVQDDHQPASAAGQREAEEFATPASALAKWEGDPRFMQSLARGLLALTVVARGGGAPVSVREVAAATGLSPASAQRCIYTLNGLGYVRANRNGAVSGPALADLASSVTTTPRLIAECGPVLDALHAELGMTVSLATFGDDKPTIVASKSSDSLLRLELPVGTSVPLHCTSTGKIYLAGLGDESLRQRLFEIEFTVFTPHTVDNIEGLMKQIVAIRRQGYAISEQELMIGIRGASVPIVDAQKRTQAVLTATMLTPAMSLRDVRSVTIPGLQRAAAVLSHLLN